MTIAELSDHIPYLLVAYFGIVGVLAWRCRIFRPECDPLVVAIDAATMVLRNTNQRTPDDTR
jgi:hypothetical protein